MTRREKIKAFREIVLPFISELLSDIDYEGLGKLDAEEFAKDFNEILDLAAKALEQEPCDDCVSRQVVKEQMLKYGFHASNMTVTEFVEDLPPVLPKRERSDKE